MQEPFTIFRLFCRQSFRCTFQSLLWLRMHQPCFPWHVLIAGDSGRESLLAPPYGGDAGQPDVYPKAFRASKLQNTIKMALSKFSLYLVLLSFNVIFTCSKIRSKLFTMLLKSTWFCGYVLCNNYCDKCMVIFIFCKSILCSLCFDTT